MHPKPSLDNFKTSIEQLPGILILTNIQSEILASSAGAKDFLGLPSDKTRLSSFLRGQQQEFNSILENVNKPKLHTETNSIREEHTFSIAIEKDIHYRHAELEVKLFFDEARKPHFLVFSIVCLKENQLLSQELNLTRKILDHDLFNIGIHIVDVSKANEIAPKNPQTRRIPVVWKNRWSTDEFNWTTRNPNILDIISTKNHEETSERIKNKALGKAEPTTNEPRTFIRKPQKAKGVGVEEEGVYDIEDHFIYDVPSQNGATPKRILTVVVPQNFSEPLLNHLRSSGIHYPWLEEHNISAFRKEYIGEKWCIVKTNREFCREFENDEETHSKLDRLLANNNVDPPKNFEKKWEEALKVGLTDHDLYKNEYATKYIQDDTYVRNQNEEKQGLESHTNELGECKVQFLKIPCFDQSTSTVTAIDGYFWRASKTKDIIADLTTLFYEEKQRVLDSLPELFHVLRKDKDLRFTFCNEQHAHAHGKEISDFIGKKDCELFPDRGRDYETDDMILLKSDDRKKIIAKTEFHEFGQGESDWVTVVKSLWMEDENVRGVQCIYWREDALRRLRELNQTEKAAYASKSLNKKVFISVANESLEIAQEAWDNLRAFSPYLYTNHVAKGEIEDEIRETIKKSNLYLLVISDSFWKSDFIDKVELPLILEACKNDTRNRKLIPIYLNEPNPAAIRPVWSYISRVETPQFMISGEEHKLIPKDSEIRRTYWRMLAEWIEKIKFD